MYQLVESIWIKNGEVQNLDLHQKRYELSLKAFYPESKPYILSEAIDPSCHPFKEIKLRIQYDNTQIHLEYNEYHRRQINKIKKVYSDEVTYPYKTINREILDKLYQTKEDSDEILIIKNGFVTDAYYYNLVFENENGFFTPQTYLLNGIMRQKLLLDKTISEKTIHESNIQDYQYIHLINALNPLGYCRLNIDSFLD